ncbi:MAG: hypothetical protein CFH26_00094 [Alphaproteobacteria bacterium MarineAlpha6_Bin4]|nr:MAG: hypothetical protein CFH27_00061 [Alphaproteobacteria bacterium MarineAlpha6_Bin5]PPR38366.1 MAG: hypothetical protein CFH26_00094 [Alphaproteobacteria bacterium MarineAlpha6_Bin4]|tara:strand:- start:238 stop:1245 length:1008 start_codon:yes stop_codon:yes gene_type:complete
MNDFKKLSLALIIFLLIIFNTIEAKENSAAVFVYHRFGENNYPSTNVKLSQFKKHLNELTKNDYNVIPVEKIVDSFINNTDLPEKTVGITIDDAFLSIYKEAWPLLKEKKLPFTIFVSTKPVGSKSSNYMNWSQIKEMVNSGVSIGHHSKSHHHLVSKNQETLVEEIEDASKDFLENIGFVPEIFAYPYGEYSYEIKQTVKKYFKAAFGQHSGSFFNGIDIYEMPRFSLNEKYGDIKRFKFAANSYGLKINNILPKDRAIKDLNPPLLGFTLIDSLESKIQCYPSHNIKAELKKIGKNRIEIRFDKEFPKGRTRINCTTNDNGKWRWTGFQFTNP